MTTVEAFAPAKINLTLHVSGQRPDGYHELDSLVVFARDLGDRVTVQPSDTMSLAVSGPFAKGVPADGTNLVLKAAELLRRLRGVRGSAHIELKKFLPSGGGIGGGSSDAAATIRSLSELWGVAPLSGEEALTLGADLPVCLRAPTATHMQGIGEILSDAGALPKFWLVLINPGIHVSTPEVFRRLAELHSTSNPPMDALPRFADALNFEVWLAGQRNDLTNCVCDIQTEVLECLRALRGIETCVKADMSGSGSTCWGLFWEEEDARAAAGLLQESQAGWWVRQTAVDS